MLDQLALFASRRTPTTPNTEAFDRRHPPEPAEDLADAVPDIQDSPAAEFTEPVDGNGAEDDLTERGPFLLTDPTPDLLDEVRQRQEFIDLRWWPEGDMHVSLEAFEAPGRAADVLASLRHRQVPDADIRDSLQENWRANGATEATRIANVDDRSPSPSRRALHRSSVSGRRHPPGGKWSTHLSSATRPISSRSGI